MNPQTWKSIKERLEENMRYMDSDSTDSMEYELMQNENETMEWICALEGKTKDFIDYGQKIAIQIEYEETK